VERTAERKKKRKLELFKERKAFLMRKVHTLDTLKVPKNVVLKIQNKAFILRKRSIFFANIYFA